jgi:hypothetical protein
LEDFANFTTPITSSPDGQSWHVRVLGEAINMDLGDSVYHRRFHGVHAAFSDRSPKNLTLGLKLRAIALEFWPDFS